jgi:gas vesicle protein
MERFTVYGKNQPITIDRNPNKEMYEKNYGTRYLAMSTKNYWLAFGIGVSAGAAIALLYAPQTGTKTRRQLRKGVEDAGDYLEDAGDYLKSQAERFSNEAQKAVKRTREQVETAVDKAGDVVSNAVKTAQSLV